MTVPSRTARETLADLIAEERDKYPRRADDMDSEELADAILSAFPGIRETIEGPTEWEYGEASRYGQTVWLVDPDGTPAIWDGVPPERRRPASPWEVCDE